MYSTTAQGERTSLLRPSNNTSKPLRYATYAGILAAIVGTLFIFSLVSTTLSNTEDDFSDRDRMLNHTSVGRFLHITDMHLDPNYLVGSTKYSSCHRKPPHPRTLKKDRHKETGLFGLPEDKCDSPLALINATRDYLQILQQTKSIDYVIWTGDSGRHDNDADIPRTFEEIIEQNKIAAERLRQAFADSIPIVPNIGNNDISPHNELGVPEKGSRRARKTFRQLANVWRKMVPDDQLSTFYYGGYFARDVVDFPNGGGVTVLSLNTIYWYRANAKVGGCRADDSPGLAQLAWIRYQIRRARQRNRDLVLIGHVVPNRDNYRPTCYHGYARTVTQLIPPPALEGNARGEQQPTIHAQLFGHNNVDVWAFVGQEAEWLASQDPLKLKQENFTEDRRLWWEKEVDEETGRFGKLIRDVWSPNSSALNQGEEERAWEAMEDDPAHFEFKWPTDVATTTATTVKKRRLPEDFVESLFAEYKRVLIQPPQLRSQLGVTTISPSIIPKYFPGFRLFYYLRKSISEPNLPKGTLLDYEVYWSNLYKQNKELDTKRFFEVLYRFSNVYGVKDLSLDSYILWAQRLLSSKKLRKKFRALTYVNSTS